MPCHMADHGWRWDSFTLDTHPQGQERGSLIPANQQPYIRAAIQEFWRRSLVKHSGKCYFLERSKKNHHDANENCKTIFGPNNIGKLFEPNNKNINDVVLGAALAKLGSNGHRIWMGFNDKASEGNFKTLSGGSLPFTNWH